MTAAIPVRFEDIVLTGCGRAYVFPPDTPARLRLAGMDHPRFRIGYVERHQNGWQPRDIGDRPLAPATPSRTEALYRLLIRSNRLVDRGSLRPRLTLLGATFPIADDGSPIISVFHDKLGTVLIGDRRGERTPRRLAPVGTVWMTGDRVAALSSGRRSRDRTLYATRRGAIGALLTAAGYGRLFTARPRSTSHAAPQPPRTDTVPSS